MPPIWSAPIAIHFAHRVWALFVLCAIIMTTSRVWTGHPHRPELRRPAVLLLVLVCAQIALGGIVVMSGLQPFLNTLHVVNGALVLGTSLVLTLRSSRPLLARVPVRDDRRAAASGTAPLGARS
jgi:cytochrome c oxidase assembly protein subunit 15